MDIQSISKLDVCRLYKCPFSSREDTEAGCTPSASVHTYTEAPGFHFYLFRLPMKQTLHAKSKQRVLGPSST